MLSKKLPILYVLLAALAGSLVTFWAVSFSSKPAGSEKQASDSGGQSQGQPLHITRDQRSYKYISPIIAVEPVNESEKLATIKSRIADFIAGEKNSGSLISASVYLKEFTGGNWMAINPTEVYNPGSLLKVGVLITYYRMAEKDNTLLDKEVTYHGERGFVFPVEHYTDDTVTEGKKYKISELMRYMIRNSDNRATVFLENWMDTTIFKQEFEDLGITRPRFNDPTYSLNVVEYSMMLRALYNAGYLRKRASENALAMLAESNFSKGLLRELPRGLEVAHKFGESGDANIHELHESGIVYLGGNPYMITIMTKGTDWEKLSADIGHISRMAYDELTSGRITAQR
jgi:beta-lactamase class A